MYVIREKMFRLTEDSDITDESGEPVLQVDGKIMSLHQRLILRDPAGREVAQVHRKLVALRPSYEIIIDGKNVAEVRQHLFTPFRQRLTIDLPGAGDMEISGDHKIYTGYWLFGRPTVEEPRMDLRAVLMQCHWDWTCPIRRCGPPGSVATPSASTHRNWAGHQRYLATRGHQYLPSRSQEQVKRIQS